MTWQDELRRLDEELAGGRVSADEYRQRRDQLLAAANNNPNTGGQPAQQPPQQPQQQGGNPFPPPFRWETAAPSADATQMVQPTGEQQNDPAQQAEATQVVRNVGAPGADATQMVSGFNPQTGADSTQVVPGQQYPGPQYNQPGGAEATQMVSGFNPQAGADSTQVVRGTPSGGFPQIQPQQGWPQQNFNQQGWPQQGQQQGWPQQVPGQQFGADPNAASPWGGPEAPGADPSWMRQGPEVFEDGGGSNTGKIIAIVVGVVAVIGIAVGAFFLWGSGSSSTPAAGSNQPATSTQSPASSGPIAAGIPGKTQDGVTKSVKTFSDVTSMHTPLVAKEEQSAFETAGASDTSLLFNDDNGNGILIMAVKADSPDSAKQAVSDLDQQQVKFGLADKTSPVKGVSVTGLDNVKDTPSAPVLRRAHYSSMNEIIRIEIRGKDMATVDDLLKDVLQKQTTALKPDAS